MLRLVVSDHSGHDTNLPANAQNAQSSLGRLGLLHMQMRSTAARKESVASGACGLAIAPESLASPVRTAAHGHLDNAVKFLSADSGSMKAGGLDGERYEAWVAGVDPGTG